MADPINSLNDPIFYLHHGGLDYLWALWQEQDPKRLRAGKDAVEGQLRDVPLWMGVFATQKSSFEVLDTSNRDGKGFLCYKYDGLSIKSYLS